MESQILADAETPIKVLPTISREKELAKIVADVEAEAIKTAAKMPARRHFNQPSLVSLNSLNAISESANATAYSQIGFSQFEVNLPLPVLDVESLQLLSANIPQASANISDSSLVFWYYRLAEIQNKTPTVDNLYCVRLLPSYYRPEFITGDYGTNRTFKKYSDLATELAKSCVRDLAWTNWLADPINFLNSTPAFCPGDISITYNATLNKFQCAGNYALRLPAYKSWDFATAYNVNDQVIYQLGFPSIFVTFICVVNVPAGTGTPDLLPFYWQRNNQPFVPIWSNVIPYTKGQYATQANILYVAKLASTGATPSTSPTYWDAVNVDDTQFVWNYYLLTGPSDPNVIAKQNSVISGGDQIGLYEISKEFDFRQRTLGYTFPVGIPPQPFLPAPKRLLNTVLGFTWNGVFNPSDLTVISGSVFNRIPTEITQLYNRLRPVPFYTTESLLLGTYGASPVETNFYTADGYCNLVFSSVISVYSTIVLASSVDTQRTSNLLAVIPLNCGNLGVTFANNFIDNPLTKVNGDIYTIGVELRNEYSEPYYLTNNAVATFVFKMTYKEPLKVLQNIM